MKKRLVIGILGIPAKDDEDFETVAIYENYRKLAVSKNFIILMIPPYNNIDYFEDFEDVLTEKEKSIYKEMIDMCDGLILPGGYRIYNYYKYIINYALEKNMPIFGTCLGMQILALMDNNSNCQQLYHKQKHIILIVY